MEKYIKTIINTDKEAEVYRQAKLKELNDNRINFNQQIDNMKLECEKELEGEKIRIQQQSMEKSMIKIQQIEKGCSDNIEKLQEKYTEIKKNVIEKLFLELKEKIKEWLIWEVFQDFQQ